MDNDTLVLQDAHACVMNIDVQYKMADFNTKKQLKKYRDRAFNVYAMARLELLTDEVICTDEDVQQMHNIRQQVEQAANTQALISGMVSLLGFLISF